MLGHCEDLEGGLVWGVKALVQRGQEVLAVGTKGVCRELHRADRAPASFS